MCSHIIETITMALRLVVGTHTLKGTSYIKASEDIVPGRGREGGDSV